ncbi:MAG: VWA domain-containing protein [Verrucomicrobiaceae bacterium]
MRAAFPLLIVVTGISTGYAQDILFLHDASGSVGNAGWNQGIEFAASVIETGLSESERVAIAHFTTSGTVAHQFTDNQDRGVAANVARNLIFNPGQAGDLVAGINFAGSLFDGQSAAETPKLMFFVTDGSFGSLGPAQMNGIRDTLETRDIVPIVIGVGSGWNPNGVDFMVDDPDLQVIEASSFTSESFDAIRDVFVTVPEPSAVFLLLMAPVSLLGRRRG